MSDTRTADAANVVQSGVASFTCPNCGAFSQHEKQAPDRQVVYELGKAPIQPGGGLVVVHGRHVVMRCVACKKDTYFLIGDERGVFQILHQHPLPIMATHPLLSKDIAGPTLEAEKSLAVGAPNACGVMCRRAMHVLCQDKNATGKDLHDQLKDLRDRHEITPDLWEWAEELRVVGKHGAHPEWEDVTMEDADYAMRFLREILRYVYVNPAERAARKLKETSAKK
jgi:hypothetical protein